jgi:hypothetical protein
MGERLLKVKPQRDGCAGKLCDHLKMKSKVNFKLLKANDLLLTASRGVTKIVALAGLEIDGIMEGHGRCRTLS